MSGNGSNAFGGFLFAQQLSDHTADDGLSSVLDFCDVAWNFFIACNLEMVLLTKFVWGGIKNMFNLMINSMI